jgi:hypothetical protein
MVVVLLIPIVKHFTAFHITIAQPMHKLMLSKTLPRGDSEVQAVAKSAIALQPKPENFDVRG